MVYYGVVLHDTVRCDIACVVSDMVCVRNDAMRYGMLWPLDAVYPHTVEKE